MIREGVRRFIDDAGALHRIIAGLSRDDLIAHPVPGTWSIQQIAIHLLDSDLAASHRMKRIIAEDTPLLIAYDETRFAATLGYHQQSVQAAADLFRLNRLHMGEILLAQPELAFARAGVHNQRGKVTLAEMVQMYVGHVEHHMKFVRQKRDLLGKPMTN
jgi:DinB superfamily